MGGLISAAQLILALSLLVFIHELGHFLAARAFGIRCDKFYIFFDAFGKKLWSKKIGETEYGIGWLPLGGYVKIAGMIDESMDKEELKKEPQPDEFRSKPPWQRFIVMIGGIVMNVILGLIIFTGLLKIGEKAYTDPTSFENGIVAHELGEEIGFKDGDKIVGINGKKVNRWKDLVSPGLRFGGEVQVNRGGQELSISVPDTLFSDRRPMFGRFEDVSILKLAEDPLVQADGTSISNTDVLKEGDKMIAVNGSKFANFYDMSRALSDKKNQTVALQVERGGQLQNVNVQLDSLGRMGFQPSIKTNDNAKKIDYSMGQAIKYAAQESWETVYFNAKGFALIFAGKLNFWDNVQSPVGIAQYFGPTWNWYRFWYLTGLISLVLAFMNILPIPALDGGHMLFILFELILGRPLSDTFLERAQMLGMLILIPLMLLILGKDILKLITG